MWQQQILVNTDILLLAPKSVFIYIKKFAFLLILLQCWPLSEENYL